MNSYTYISNADSGYIDKLYEDYKKDASLVDASWQKFFEGLEFSLQSSEGRLSDTSVSSFAIRVRELMDSYRSKGHLLSRTNPIRERRNHNISLHHSNYGLTDADMSAKIDLEEGKGKLGVSTLKDLLAKMKKVYLGPIGFEYTHIRNEEVIRWFIDQCEQNYYSYEVSQKEKKNTLVKLNEAVVFENFLHTKFLGQKRFSLEGGENTIPFLQTVINAAAVAAVKEVVIGMAHRGRLNVLSNILGKTYEQIFTEFEGNVRPDMTMGDGDVKYHQGYAGYVVADNQKKIYVKLTPNPSHLEAVDPLVLGYTRGQIDDEYAGDVKKTMAILIHGDSAIAGQGILYEIAQMSGLSGYHVGGAIHFVINNQVGFTTDYEDARTSIYCTDLAKIIDAPILHVNGDDAEAILFCAKLAVLYRQRFGKDIFIDMVCYRRHGHNESDEPRFTQPQLYDRILKHPNPREIYLKRLLGLGDIDAELADEMNKKFRSQLQDRLNEVKQKKLPYKAQKIEEEWRRLRKAKPSDFDQSPSTGITKSVIEKVSKALITVPPHFNLLRQIEKLLKDRKASFFEKKILGWADAELLAYGSLLLEGVTVRMSGQDVRRGTFSHRHAYLVDKKTNELYCNLDHIDKKQNPFYIFNSLLSEFGVLGFEYGYAMASPNALVLWEAQFGDFANGAQVMIDQFIASAESKWQRMNGLVLLLPHGYEGQGPEHSSAKPERFLQLAAEYNIVLSYPTTAANFFHLLRRQMAWNFRKPCIIFSPKSLLRSTFVSSPLNDFMQGSFQEVLQDVDPPKQAQKLLLCTGKIYYDLIEERKKKNVSNVAIMRIEQLYPFPEKRLLDFTKQYRKAQWVWVQEEPANMGFISFIRRMMPDQSIEFISRKESASPATGYAKTHQLEQLSIIERALH